MWTIELTIIERALVLISLRGSSAEDGRPALFEEKTASLPARSTVAAVT